MTDVAAAGRVVLALGRRGLSTQFRKAQLLMPTFVLPLMLLAVISSGTGAGQDLPGFPAVDSYLTFVVPGTIVQGALLAGLTAGTAMAMDIEFGFFDRLLAAPVPRVSIVLGRIAGTLALSVVQTVWFLIIALAFGADYKGGPLAILAAIGLASLTAAGIGGLTAAMALRTGSLSLLQSIFPFVFVGLFTAPAFFPRELLTPALQDAAAVNPLTFIVESVRALLIDDPGVNVWWGVLSAFGLLAVTVTLATMALKGRLRRL